MTDSVEDVLEEWVGEGDTRWNVRWRGESASSSGRIR
jgi:hypothetical protein